MWREYCLTYLRGAAGIGLFLVLTAGGVRAEETPLTLWHSYRGAEERALKLVLEKYKAATGERVRALGIPHDAFASKITTAIPRNNGPDLFIFAHERLGGWVNAHLVSPLDESESVENVEEFLPGTLEALRYEGRLYGLPLAFKSLVLFYNKSLVKIPPVDTDGLLETARRLKRLGRYGIAYQSNLFYFHAPWYFGFGGKLNLPDSRPDFRSEEALASFEFLSTLVEEELIPAEPTGALVTQLFNAGQVGMVVSGPWMLGELSDTLDVGLAPLPRVSATSQPASPFLTEEGVFVSNMTVRKGRARALARFLAGAESARIRASEGRQLVANKRVWESEGFADDPIMGVFAKQLNAVVPMYNGPMMQNIWEPFDLALKKVVRGGSEASEALIAAERRYLALTREAPREASRPPYILAGVALLLGVVFWLIRNVVRLTRDGEWPSFREGWSWVFPGMSALGVLVVVPFVVSLCLSFFSHREGEWVFVGLGNFVSILTSESFGVFEPLSFYYALVVTVAWTLLNLILHVIIGVGLALLLNQKGLRLRGMYRVLLILPWAVPNYITALIWKGLFHRQHGAINGMLESLGFEGIAWFSSFGTAFFANVCTNSWLGFPFIMVVCLGALQAIPQELYDAAEVDGAGSWDRFRLLTLPLLKPAMAPAVLLGIIWTFNQFNIVYLVSSGEPDNSTDILISEVYRWAFSRQEQYGYAAAYASLIFVLLLVWSIFSTRIARRIEEAV